MVTNEKVGYILRETGFNLTFDQIDEIVKAGNDFDKYKELELREERRKEKAIEPKLEIKCSCDIDNIARELGKRLKDSKRMKGSCR